MVTFRVCTFERTPCGTLWHEMRLDFVVRFITQGSSPESAYRIYGPRPPGSLTPKPHGYPS